jgi:hypothetical protein
MTFALTLLGFAAATFIAPKAVSQESGWITLFDGKSMNGWSPVGESNWHIEDGVLIADKLGSKELAYLVNSNSYKKRHLFPLPRSQEAY